MSEAKKTSSFAFRRKSEPSNPEYAIQYLEREICEDQKLKLHLEAWDRYRNGDMKDAATTTALTTHGVSEPLNWDKIEDLYEKLMAHREPPKQPEQRIDWELIKKHKIKLGYDNCSGMYVTSSAEMKRAKACGAIKFT